MVAFTVQVRSSLIPQKARYLNRAPQFLPVNNVKLHGMQPKESRVFPIICHAISENESLNSRGVVSKHRNPVIVIDNYDSFTYNLCQVLPSLLMY